MSATAYAIGNVASSVALVLVNKKVFAGGFVRQADQDGDRFAAKWLADLPPHLEALAPLPFVAQFFRPTNGGDAQLAYEPCA